MNTPVKYRLTPAKSAASSKKEFPDYMPLFTAFVSENIRIQSQWVFGLVENLESFHTSIFPQSPNTPLISTPLKNMSQQFPKSPNQERHQFTNLVVDLELMDPCDAEDCK